MLFDMWWFNQFALEVLRDEKKYSQVSLGAYLHDRGYSDSFKKNYIFPLLSSIWIHDPQSSVSEIPVVMAVRYLYNHCLLNTFTSSVEWLIVKGGAKVYVDALINSCASAKLERYAEVAHVYPITDKGVVKVCLRDETEEYFDHVIIATSAPEALRLLGGGDITEKQRKILDMFRTTKSRVVLHKDKTFLPDDPKLRSAWNYHDNGSPCNGSSAAPRVSLTACMSDIMGLGEEEGLILSTLNPARKPEGGVMEFEYEHPKYDGSTMDAQKELDSIQGKSDIWFAGAWAGDGFHEEGLNKGIECAMEIMQYTEDELPFTYRNWKAVERQPATGVIGYIQAIFAVVPRCVTAFFRCFTLGFHPDHLKPRSKQC
ncbi:hypothetical protein BDV33DRAFT_66554 [Aspergillus novoparasiticus]|uniref:Amine oxidase domain-containing protein n=1 Tax=Aspergillus novoparasiticus TaxID=986946 RepID=A0A5N6E7M9_9EURO|nr:hypothetical protein BDV33DRAFT_66554 [Aspergillus novoparasiticus]